jgi:hypothetical protein
MEIQKKVTKTIYETIGYKCDVCSKSMVEPFYQFEHHHSDWGNDSVDSYEYFHICSIECYFKRLQKSVKELENHDTAEIDDKSIEFINNLLKYFDK